MKKILNGKLGIVTIVLGVVLIGTLSLSTTFSLFYNSNKLSNSESYTTGTLSVELLNADESGNTINLTNAMPTADDASTRSTYTLRVTNKGSLVYTFDLKLTSTTTENAVSNDYVKIQVGTDTAMTYASAVANSNKIKTNITLAPTGQSGSSLDIPVKIWLASNTPNSQIGKRFTATLTADGVGTMPATPSLASLATLGLEVTNSEVAPYSERGETVEINATSDNVGDSYYLKGNHTSNYIKFANYYWRLVRINGDGSYRIIYDGTSAHSNTESSTDRQINTSAFNQLNNDNAYVGYMYGEAGSESYDDTHFNNASSAIKIKLDEWYKANIEDKGFGDKVADTIYCNDRSMDSGVGAKEFDTAYRANGRLVEVTSPQLYCPQKTDAFSKTETEKSNSALTYPVGLLTADEAAAAGAIYSDRQSTTYLYTGQKYWTMTPDTFKDKTARVFYVNDNGSLSSNTVSETYGIRPVISLSKDTQFQGTGSMEDPWVVQ